MAVPIDLKNTRFVSENAQLGAKALAYKNGTWIDFRNWGDQEFGAAYGIHSTSGDFAKWLIALMKREGLDKASYQELLGNQIELPEGHPSRADGITHMSLGFFKGTFPFGTGYGHGGNNDKKFTCLFVFIPESQWGMVLFTNSGFGEEMGLNLFKFFLTPR